MLSIYIMGYKINKIYVGDKQARPSGGGGGWQWDFTTITTAEWQNDFTTRSGLTLQEGTGLTITSGTNVKYWNSLLLTDSGSDYNCVEMEVTGYAGGSWTNMHMLITDAAAPSDGGDNYQTEGLSFAWSDYSNSSTYAWKSLGCDSGIIQQQNITISSQTTWRVKYNWDTGRYTVTQNGATLWSGTDTSAHASSVKTKLSGNIYFNLGGIRSGSNPVFTNAFVKLTKE